MPTDRVRACNTSGTVALLHWYRAPTIGQLRARCDGDQGGNSTGAGNRSVTVSRKASRAPSPAGLGVMARQGRVRVSSVREVLVGCRTTFQLQAGALAPSLTHASSRATPSSPHALRVSSLSSLIVTTALVGYGASSSRLSAERLGFARAPPAPCTSHQARREREKQAAQAIARWVP